jgi:hypothetical protein
MAMISSAKGILDGFLQDGKVVLQFRLGMAEGITIYSRRGPETEFSQLTEDEPAPVVDARPKLDPDAPETRRYRAVLLYSGEESRKLSNEIEIVVP